MAVSGHRVGGCTGLRPGLGSFTDIASGEREFIIFLCLNVCVACAGSKCVPGDTLSPPVDTVSGKACSGLRVGE